MTTTREHLAGLELLPCPFCGNEAELRQYDGDHFAQCLHCFCSTPADLGTEGEAAQAWNTRAKSSPVQGESVEVVCITQDGCDVTWTANKELSPTGTELMTVAQHNRIMAAAKPDAELVELLERAEALLVVARYKAQPTRDSRLAVLDGIRAKLATLSHV